MTTIDDKLLDASFDLEGEIITLRDYFYIDQDSISDGFSNNAARLAYIGAKCAIAEANLKEVKAKTDLIYADIELDYRADHVDTGIKITEAKLKSLVTTDPEFQKISKEEIVALQNFKILKAMTYAMSQRGDMLISLGATLRKEYDITDLRMYEMKSKLMQDS